MAFKSYSQNLKKSYRVVFEKKLKITKEQEEQQEPHGEVVPIAALPLIMKARYIWREGIKGTQLPKEC